MTVSNRSEGGGGGSFRLIEKLAEGCLRAYVRRWGPIPKLGIVRCRGCGRCYHKSWGAFCSDCTGAD